MHITFPYGGGTVEAELDWAEPLGTLDTAAAPPLENPEAAIRRAIEHPIGLQRSLFDRVAIDDTIVIVVSDQTRQTGADVFLPVLVNGLNEAGAPDERISFLFATGVHRPPTEQEQARLLGEALYQRFRPRVYCHDAHDAANLVYLGTTSRGTPVHINRRACEARRLIVTGTVMLHYFGGYGGGRKSVAPGIAGAATIAHNHAMNLDPDEDRLDPAVRIGVMDGNPVAEDMLEAARFTGVNCVINTVMNRQGEIAGIFAGELNAAHRAAAEFAHSVFATPLERKADLVIAAAGSAPNFVQTHKALYNTYQAVRPGGRIILLAECPEGLGGESFEKWLRLGARDTIIAALRRQSEINGQTALSTLEKGPNTILLTELSDADVRLLGAQRAGSLTEALERARHDLRKVKAPSFYLMPSASFCVPIAAE